MVDLHDLYWRPDLFGPDAPKRETVDLEDFKKTLKEVMDDLRADVEKQKNESSR